MRNLSGPMPLIAIFVITLAAAVSLYIVWTIWDFNSRHARDESRYLAQYTERALSRVQLHSPRFSHATAADWQQWLGSDESGVLPDYAALKQRFPDVPDPQRFSPGKIAAVVLSYHGVWQVPSYLLVLPVARESGQTLYAYRLVDEELAKTHLGARIFERAQPAILIALVSILALILVELRQIKQMNRNIADFAAWTSRLSAGNRAQPAPKFSSDKFNYMAYAIDKNLAGISDVLQKEQSFAKFTSHELRTSIAVLSANMEVLDLILKDLSPQERKVLTNMESAVSDMKYQMEALLWLSREGDGDLVLSACDLNVLANKAIDDNQYLVEGKSIRTRLQGEGGMVQSNPVFVQIILNNLLRNAYQNTTSGDVTIELSSRAIAIDNQSAQPNNGAAVGFGIGLVLVEKLVRKLGLDYRVDIHEGGRRVTLQF